MYIYIFVYCHLHCVAFLSHGRTWSKNNQRAAFHFVRFLSTSLCLSSSLSLSLFFLSLSLSLFIYTGSNRQIDRRTWIDKLWRLTVGRVCPSLSLSSSTILQLSNSLSPSLSLSLSLTLPHTCAKNTYTHRTWHRLNSNSKSNSLRKWDSTMSRSRNSKTSSSH